MQTRCQVSWGPFKVRSIGAQTEFMVAAIGENVVAEVVGLVGRQAFGRFMRRPDHAGGFDLGDDLPQSGIDAVGASRRGRQHQSRDQRRAVRDDMRSSNSSARICFGGHLAQMAPPLTPR